ncbi:MAG: hypothetical protein ACOX30_02370 [Dethiobacteria bacterium]
MMTFHVVHIAIGLWLALVNVTGILAPATLPWNNLILGLIIAAYNVYYLLAQKRC